MELLVVLAILVGMLTAATVSVETLQQKHRADKTVRIGRQVVADLERADGLSFVSDFGQLPQTVNELDLLFLPATNLYAHQLLTFPAGTPVSVTSHVNLPMLGTGWRGPYSRAAGGKLLDGWGSEWSFATNTLTSLGRDGQPGGTDWQDQDLLFPVQTNRVTGNVDLTVSISLLNSTNSIGNLTAVCFLPRFDGSVTNRTVAGTNSPSLMLNRLSVGLRALLVYADAGTNVFGEARTVMLQPGNNHIELKLPRLD